MLTDDLTMVGASGHKYVYPIRCHLG